MSSDRIEEAARHHQAGRLDDAARLYAAILADAPENADVLHRLGAIALQRGDGDEAARHLENAARLRPNDAHIHYNLGVANQATSRDEDAADAFRRAIQIEPGYAAAHVNLGRLHLGRGDRDGAILCFKRAVAADDGLAEAHFNLGEALRETGRLDDEIACYERAIERNPGLVAAFVNLGIALREQGWPGPAETSLRQALDLDPDNGPAKTRLGLVLMELGRLDEAAAAILEPARRLRAVGVGNGTAETFRRTNPTKLESDGEQLRHLVEGGMIDASFADIADECDRMSAAWDEPAVGDAGEFPLSPSRRFTDTYNRMVHLAEVPAVTGPAINPDLDEAAVAAAFGEGAPGLTHIDDFLTDDALAGLQRFCRDSTVWHQMQFPGELSASLPNGFCSPLFLQVARDIRLALPSVFGEHLLTTFWAYKYFGSSSGIETHADRGAFSVNLWITPDEANRNPSGGGLVLWDRLAPNDYFGAPRDRQGEMLKELVEDPTAKAITVPYRCNRAVLFRSNVIHRTDDLDFEPGINNRRINVTFIYGYPDS